MTFEEMQKDFIVRRKGSLALPITGVLVYSAAAVISLLVAPALHNLVLASCFWAILPVGLLVSRLRGEEFRTRKDNPLFGLSAKARVMALSTWAIHIPIWLYAPSLFPISVGIGFALHWIIFSWTIGHPVGFMHLAMRIVFVLSAWHLVPTNRMGAVSAGIALAYAISLVQLCTIDWQKRFGLAHDPRWAQGTVEF
jgi:hypothetical protein